MDRRHAAATGRHPAAAPISTVPALLADRARRYPEAVAIAGPAGRRTYAELAEEVGAVTRAAIASGIEAGDRVGMWAPNGIRWITAALGMLGAGATLVPISTRLRGAETAEVLCRSRAKAVCTVQDFLGVDYPAMLAEHSVTLPELEHLILLDDSPGESIEDWDISSWQGFLAPGTVVPPEYSRERSESVAPDAISDILFTSGTTGAPKGVLATHEQTLKVFAAWADAVTLRPRDRYLLVNPFSHTFGYKAGIIACLLKTATMVPIERFETRAVLRLIENERITVLAGPPTLFNDLLHADRSDFMLGSLRLAGTGGATVPAELVDRIREELGVPYVFTAYGLTESIGVVTVCPPAAPTELVAGTAGKALPGTEIRITDRDGTPVAPGEEGEITVKGPNVMLGYLDDPEATAAVIDPDGYLHTGDIGTLDADGYLRITDRLKDMFIVGGFNAYPAEIERILLQHPDIRDVAVVGVPDARLGEVGRAVVVPQAGIDDAEAIAEAIIEWSRDKLAGYKVPREIVFTDQLPRNAGGKVLKGQLRNPA
ncbi:FadD3 family acyl-CoA ligase [Nocardia yamanashiensis]|uniref:FadD3 family acyl-CoA ligase n=1 Tax=Nocardia yamanashiensis TaxID=209247 RepID=UPI001E54BB8D|nr:FadD3 family acyl-CoA ligase [Nocardia yamanashiensis]UGT41735.1 FadD3 family acyl-CoA ligase [Nocardia yamanashiensis]